MPKINQLSFEVANLIAAGEVVERPASVVKELLENAIDAGADSITAEIARGGISLIRIVDNGHGMEAEDLPVAIRRHATSKIRTAEDLDAIATLGFRGEALAAISAVSEVTIISKTREALSGTMLTAKGGSVLGVEEVGCADGTTVLVENLFGNVPARRKFLKKDVTEAQAVAALVEKVAMSRPDIAIRFISDGTVRFTTAGDGDLLHTLYALYGRDYAARLISVSGEVGGIRVSGFIGRPDNAKGNRNHQNCFINRRYVRSKTVSAATERAYTSYMAPERFPVAVLCIDMPGFAVDVNVHPAKLEVKFSDERAVFEAVYYTIRDALEKNTERPAFAGEERESERRRLTHSFPSGERGEQLRIPTYLRPESKPSAPPPPPTLSPEKSEQVLRTLATGRVESQPSYDPKPTVYGFPREEEPKECKPTVAPSPAAAEKGADAPITTGGATSAPTAPPTQEVPPSAPAPQGIGKIPREEREVSLPPYRIAGILFRCYVLVELEGDKVLVIDQHAAHERILFEALKRKRKEDTRVLSVGLLLPLTVSLSREELAAATEYKAELSALGFDYRIDGDKVLLLAIPDEVTPSEAEALFARMCDDLDSGAADPAVTEEMRRERLLYQIACKAAIKGGRVYDDAHIEWLVREVLSLPDVTVCPHGRPVAFTLTKNQMDKMFDRIK